MKQPTHESRDPVRASARAAALITMMLVFVTALHLYSSMYVVSDALHEVFRRLYYFPIIYAAFTFGSRGGVPTAFVSAASLLLHAAVDEYVLWGAKWVDDASEIVLYVVVGLVVGVLRDLEEAKTRDLRQVSLRLEEAYRKLEERAIQLINVQDYTQSILRSITSGVLTVGPDASVTTMNPAAERLLGVTEYEVVPRPVGAAFSDDGGIEADVRRVLVGRTPVVMRDVTANTVSGRVLHLQLSVSRMRAVGGRVLGAVITFEDVSEVRALTDQLVRADRLAAMGELTAGVAHEVRNPLGIIKASVQLLEEGVADPQRIVRYGEVIKQEIDRLDKVIKALLDFGRPSKATMLLTDPVEVLRDVVLFSRSFASKADVEIVDALPESLVGVMADPDKLKQVFLNLITNAVQAMADSPQGTITLSARRAGDYIAISVADTGPGIAPDVLPKVFDPFYSTRDGGTGLGLTIVHRIIDEHSGRIEVESGEDGTVFTVVVPVAFDGDVRGES